jgi:uncharacterized protein (DUF433 family)
MPIDTVFANLGDGFTVDEIVEVFDARTHEQVNAVSRVRGRNLDCTRIGRMFAAVLK